MKIFLTTLFYTGISILLTFIAIPQGFGMISMCIIAFFVLDHIELLLKENREDIIVKKLNKFKSNLNTIKKILIIFSGIAIPYMLLFWAFNNPLLSSQFKSIIVDENNLLFINNIKYFDFKLLFLNNFIIVILSGIFSYLFKQYALALFLSLSSVSFGVSLGILFYNNLDFIITLKSIIFVILPFQLLITALLIISLGIYFLKTRIDKYLAPYKTFSNVPISEKNILTSVIKTSTILGLFGIALSIISVMLKISINLF